MSASSGSTGEKTASAPARSRLSVLAACTLLLTCACQVRPPGEAIRSDTAVQPSAIAAAVEAPAHAASKTPPPLPPRTAPAPKPWPEPWQPSLPAELVGLDRAAAALMLTKIDEAQTALQSIEMPNSPFDRGRWRMLQGMLAEQDGDWPAAMAAYDELSDDKEAGKVIPADVLALARTRVRQEQAHDRSLDRKRTDAMLLDAVAILQQAMGGRKGGEMSSRYGHQMAIERARLLAQVVGQGSAARRKAGKLAAKELEKTIVRFPNYPKIGELVLAQAEALHRAGETKRAADLLRKTVIDFAGSPTAKEASIKLEHLHDAAPRRIPKLRLSFEEEVARGRNARALRYVEWSRTHFERLRSQAKSAGQKDLLARELASTAYRQRDYEGCIAAAQGIIPVAPPAEEEQPPEKKTPKKGKIKSKGKSKGKGKQTAAKPEAAKPESSEETPTPVIHDEVSPMRCLERAGRVEQVIAHHLQVAQQAKRKPAKAAATWEAVEQAVVGGHYARAQELLDAYEKLSTGHPGQRRWWRAWLAHRRGQREAALQGFAGLAKGNGTLARKSRYFWGRLLLEDTSAEVQNQGQEVLLDVIRDYAFDYYGLWARQRLLLANRKVPELPRIVPPSDVEKGLDYREALGHFASASATYGAAIPALTRAHVLYAAGALEEARREVRVASEIVLALRNGGKRVMAPANEDWYVGSSWPAKWETPTIVVTPPLRKFMRSKTVLDDLDALMRTLAIAVHEPHRIARHGLDEADVRYSRWLLRAFRPAVEREAKVRKVWPTHLWGLMYTESRFRRHVVSPVGARGALQIMPWTGRQLRARLGDTSDFFDPDELYDVDKNITLAAYYIAELFKKFQGQPALAYASYNGGPSNVARWLLAKSGRHRFSSPEARRELELDDFVEEMVFDETHRYTKRVMEVEAAYRWIYEGELTWWQPKLDLKVEDNIDF